MLLQTKPKKYQLLKSNRTSPDGAPLYQIKSNCDFSDVKKGELGGYVQSEKNLSQYDDSWIYDGEVTGDVYINGNTKVGASEKEGQGVARFGNSLVVDNSSLYGGTIESKNAHIKNTVAHDIEIKGNNNVDIKSSQVSGCQFGDGVKVVNSHIDGAIIGNNVYLSGVNISGGVKIDDDVVIIDSDIFGSGDLTIHNHCTILKCKICSDGFKGFEIENADFKDSIIGACLVSGVTGEDGKEKCGTILNCYVTGSFWSSALMIGGECEDVQMTFSQKNINNIMIFNGIEIKLSNYENSNLFIGGKKIEILDDTITDYSQLGCICEDNIKQQASLLSLNNKPKFNIEDIGNDGKNQNEIEECYFLDSSTIKNSQIIKSTNINVKDSAKLDNATIEESETINIINNALINGTISESKNIGIKGSSCVIKIDEGKNFVVTGNGVILDYTGNGDNLRINGNSYIIADNLKSSIIYNTDYNNTSNVTNSIISNSTIGSIEIDGKEVSNSNIPSTNVTTPLKFNVYDDR